MTQRKQPVPSLSVSQRRPGLRECRPWQPTACQESSRKVPAVTIPTLSHNDTQAQHSCLQTAEEALELPQGWLEALLPSYRWIPWETSNSSGHNKHQEGIPRILREPAIYCMGKNVSHVAAKKQIFLNRTNFNVCMIIWFGCKQWQNCTFIWQNMNKLDTKVMIIQQDVVRNCVNLLHYKSTMGAKIFQHVNKIFSW